MNVRLHVRSWVLLASLLGASAPGCATNAESPITTEPEPEADPHSDEGTSAANDVGGGETGSMGIRECIETSECVELAEARVALLSEPLVLDRELLGGECVARDERSSENCCYHAPTVCLCYYGWDGDRTRERANALILGNRADCDEYGRDLSCVSPASAFEGCDVEDATSCDAACEALDAKLTAHNAQTFDVEVRTATCTESGACRIVTRIEDRCYAQYSPSATAYDCALSDEEIFADAYPTAAPPSCTGNVCDAGSAVSSDASTE